MTRVDRNLHEIAKYEALAKADGFRPTSIQQARQILFRYGKYLRDYHSSDIGKAGWREYAAYKSHLSETGISRATIRCYLSYITSFHRLRAQTSQHPKLLDLFNKVKALGVVRKARCTGWRPLDLGTVSLLMDAATGEDHAFLMTLLYTGGRAQFYGLRVADVDFQRGEITTTMKGGKIATIPLHPTLAAVLEDHLGERVCSSPFLFRHGKDVESAKGQQANRQNAWRTCKRVQRSAGIIESIHPHRFRKTLATSGKQMGMDPQFLQAILAHESVNITLDEYARVELEDVKREFAQLNLLAPIKSKNSSTKQRRRLLRIRESNSGGSERALRMIIDGLEGLIGDPPTSVPLLPDDPE